MDKRFLVTLTAGFSELKYSFIRKFQFTCEELRHFYASIVKKQDWLMSQSELIDKGMVTLSVVDNFDKDKTFNIPNVFLLSKTQIFEIINA